MTDEFRARVTEIIESVDDRGAWVERGGGEGVGMINSQTFVTNVHALCRFIRAAA